VNGASRAGAAPPPGAAGAAGVPGAVVAGAAGATGGPGVDGALRAVLVGATGTVAPVPWFALEPPLGDVVTVGVKEPWRTSTLASPPGSTARTTPTATTPVTITPSAWTT
jgi:hypothetical protein